MKYSEEELRMQLLAGIITESQYKQALSESEFYGEVITVDDLEEEASSIKGKRIIATVDNFENFAKFPPENTIKNVADKYNVGYMVKVYPRNSSIIFFNNSNPKSKEAISLYNRYMTDYNSLSNKEHIQLGKFFDYDNEDIKSFIEDLSDELKTNQNTLPPQTIFQLNQEYELIQDIPSDIKYSPNSSPVIKKGDRFTVTKIEPNPTNQFWMVYLNSSTYPEKKYLDFRIVPPKKPSDKYDKFVFNNLKQIK